MRIEDWFLRVSERGNPATRIDGRRPDGLAWSTGNEVSPLVHGATYFAELLARVSAMEAGDLLLFTDWRGDPDERLSPDGPSVSEVLCQAAKRGVLVRGLIWRSHWDRIQFSGEENRHLGEDIVAHGGQCLLDMRVRPGGSHHMKMVVLRHPDRPWLDVSGIGWRAGSVLSCQHARATRCAAGQRLLRRDGRWQPPNGLRMVGGRGWAPSPGERFVI